MYSVYVTGYVGNLGTKILIEEKYDELFNYFNEQFIKKIISDINGGMTPPLFLRDKIISDYQVRIIDSISIGKGGLLTALWKICEKNNFGLRFSLLNVPIFQGTIEVANYFDINPYKLYTSNAKIIIIDDESLSKERNIISDMHNIGVVTNDKKRVRIDNEIESYLTKDYKDELEKVLPRYIKEHGDNNG